MKRFTLFILLCMCALLAFPQEESLPVPHKIAVLPHSGQLSVGIDLFDLQDPDFGLTFSLDYLSDGFTPMTAPSIVGSNWVLSVGGCISRRVVGIADDISYEYNNLADSQPSVKRKGFLSYLHESSCYVDSYEQLYDDVTSNSCAAFYNQGSHEFDGMSDVYYFSVMGHSGAFIIGLDGKAKVISGDFMDINIDSLSIQTACSKSKNAVASPNDFLRPCRSFITMVDLDGVKYTFGGSAESLSYSVSLPTRSNDYQRPEVFEWYLMEVKMPNNRKLKFHYSPIESTNSLADYDFQASVRYDSSEVFSDYFLRNTLSYTRTELDSVLVHYRGDYSLSRCPRLDSITSSDGMFSAILSYAAMDDYQYSAGQYQAWGYELQGFDSFVPSQSYFLTDISFRNDSIELSRWQMDYTTLQQTGDYRYRRHYLSGLHHFSGLSYQFAYHFGEQPTVMSNHPEKLLDNMGYHISDPTLGALTSMVDPLGCTTTFTYSRCVYDSIRIPVWGNEGFYSAVRPSPSSQLVNSIVVNSIRKTGSNGIMLSDRRYEYGNYPYRDREYHHLNHAPVIGAVGDSIALDPYWVGVSSGTLNVDFAVDIAAHDSRHQYAVRAIESPRSPSQSLVEYSMVKENIYDSENHRIHQTIFHYDMTPDHLSVSHMYEGEICVFLDASAYWSQTSVRGRLRQVDNYIDSTLYHRETYTYPSIPIQSMSYIAGRMGCGIKMYLTPRDWRAQTSTSFEQGGSYTITEEKHFDEKHRLIKMLYHYPDNSTKFVCSTYPDQLFSRGEQIVDSISRAFGYLWIHKRIGQPIQTISGVVKDSTYYVTDASISFYRVYNWKGGNLPLPGTTPDIQAAARSLVIPGTNNRSEYVAPCSALSLGLESPIPMSEFAPLSIVDHHTVWDYRFDTILTCDYNGWLRPVRLSKVGQVPEVLKWDSNGLNLTSRTQGQQQRLYTYIPYRGIASETDEWGMTTYYSYDLLGNVVEAYRLSDKGEKIVLKLNQYHYKSQQ